MPLSHITALDLTLARVGPTAVRQFADWGPNPVRIERPGGSDALGGDNKNNPDYRICTETSGQSRLI